MSSSPVDPPPAARPSLPDVTLWSMGTCARCDRAKELLSSVGCKVAVRDLGTSPPTADELRALAGWLAHAGERRAGSPAAPREFVRTTGAGRALLRSKQDDETLLAELAAHPELLEHPIAVAAERKRAVVARPPELALCLLIPEAPAQMSDADLMRRIVQRKPLSSPIR